MTGPQGTQESSLAPGFVDEDIKDEGLEEVFLPEFSCLVIESSPLLDSPLLPSSFPVFLCGNWSRQPPDAGRSLGQTLPGSLGGTDLANNLTSDL